MGCEMELGKKGGNWKFADLRRGGGGLGKKEGGYFFDPMHPIPIPFYS